MAKRHKCPKCKRTFGMAAHLARHLTATHAKKTGKKVAKKKTRKAAGKKRKRVVKKKVRKAAGKKGKRVGKKKTTKKKRKVRRPKRTARKRAGRPKARRPVGRLLAEMRAYHAQLAARHDALNEEMDGIADALAALQGR